MTTTMCDRSMRILFAGGCQVSGYPWSEEYGFPALVGELLERAGYGVEVHTLPYLPLTHRPKLVAKCEEVRPDVLVLQLGHAELTRKLSKYLKRRIGGGKRAPSKESTIPAQLRKGALGFHFKASVKMAIDWLLRHPLVDYRNLEDRWMALLGDIDKLRIPAVLLLSPLPAADPTATYYRKKAEPLFRRLATQYGCTYLNVLDERPAGMVRSFGLNCYFGDPIHLGAVGQRVISEAIALQLRAILSRREEMAAASRA